MIVTFPPEIEKKIIALAAQKSIDPASLVASLVEKELSDELASAPVNGDSQSEDDADPEALNRAVTALIDRTPEQKQATRERAIREFKSGLELPPGVSAQAVMDALKGEGTDDDDPAALKKATERIANRTPAEREAVRQELLKAIPEPLPIPAGKTVFDMFFRIRGDETEEQVHEALERLS